MNKGRIIVYGPMAISTIQPSTALMQESALYREIPAIRKVDLSKKKNTEKLSEDYFLPIKDLYFKIKPRYLVTHYI